MVIPGLPDDVALECLVRLSKTVQVRVRCVSKCWNELLGSSEFQALRRKNNLADDWLFLVVTSNSRATTSTKLIAYDVQSWASYNIAAPVHAEKHLNFMGVGCASLGHLFFIVGGATTSDGTDFQEHASLHIFNAASNSWSVGADMKLPRSYFGCGCIDGCLYVAGGQEEETSAEVYNMESGRWSLVAPMPFGFNHIESSAVFRRKLYVKGLVGSTRKVLVFDPAKEVSWESCKQLDDDIQQGEFVATEDHLYLVSSCGYIGRFDEALGRWKRVGSIWRYFMPFLSGVEASINRQQAMFFGKEAFFIKSAIEEGLADLKGSKHLHKALLKTFWQCQGTVLSI